MKSFRALLRSPLHDAYRGMRPQWKLEVFHTIQKICFISKFLSNRVSYEIKNLRELSLDLDREIAEYGNQGNGGLLPSFPVYQFPGPGDSTSSNTVSSPEQCASRILQNSDASCNGAQGVKISSPVVKDFTSLLSFPGIVPVDVDRPTDFQDQGTIDSLQRLSQGGGVKLEGLEDRQHLSSPAKIDNHQKDVRTRIRYPDLSAKSNELLIDDIPHELKVKSRRRRLVGSFGVFSSSGASTSLSTGGSSRNVNSNQGSTTISVDINASRSNFSKKWKRSLESTKFAKRGKRKKRKHNTLDERAKELSESVADNVLKKSSSVGRLFDDVKPDLKSQPDFVPIWSLPKRGRGKNYQMVSVDVLNLDVLIPKESTPEDFEVIFSNYQTVRDVLSSEPTESFIKVSSIVLRLADSLFKFSKRYGIDIRNAPGKHSQYDLRFLMGECQRDLQATGMTFVDFARFSEFILKMASLFKYGTVPFLSNNIDNDKIRNHITKFVTKLNNFLKSWDSFKCPFKLLREIRALASVKSYDPNDLSFQGSELTPIELLQSSLGQMGVLSMEQQMNLERKLERRIRNDGTASTYVMRGGSVLQYLQCTNVPNISSNEQTWHFSNPLWIKLCNLLGQKLLKVDEVRIGGGKIAIMKNGHTGPTPSYLEAEPLRIPGVAANATLEDVGNESMDISNLMVVAPFVRANSYAAAVSQGRKLSISLIDDSAWIPDPEKLFLPCKHFFGKITAKMQKDNAYLQSESVTRVYTKELKDLRYAITNVEKSLENLCESTDYTERLSTKAKFMIPASNIFQGCATGLLQSDALTFAIQNLGVMCPGSYQDGLVYSQNKIEIVERRAVMTKGKVNAQFQASLEKLKRLSCTSVWFCTTSEIWDHFLTFSTQTNSKMIFN